MHQKSLSNQALVTLNQPRHAKHARRMQPSLYVGDKITRSQVHASPAQLKIKRK
jgi:hypothetical protein